MNEQHHILMFHHVAPLAGRDALRPYIVSPATFCQQLDAIVAARLPIRTMAQLAQRHNETTTHAESRSIVLTFDDCSAELWDFAIPELNRRGIKATFYAVASRFGGQNDWDDHRGGTRINLMTTSELEKLAAMGHEVGSHSMSHRRLGQLTVDEATAELRQSRLDIEAAIGRAVSTVAYPFGSIPRLHVQACRDAGYLAACSIFSPARTVLADRFAIRRILIHEADIGLRLRLKLSRSYLSYRGWRDAGLISKSAARDLAADLATRSGRNADSLTS